MHATEPQATEPQATEPQATEPQATEPQATEPQATESQATELPLSFNQSWVELKIANEFCIICQRTGKSATGNDYDDDILEANHKLFNAQIWAIEAQNDYLANYSKYIRPLLMLREQRASIYDQNAHNLRRRWDGAKYMIVQCMNSVERAGDRVSDDEKIILRNRVTEAKKAATRAHKKYRFARNRAERYKRNVKRIHMGVDWTRLQYSNPFYFDYRTYILNRISEARTDLLMARQAKELSNTFKVLPCKHRFHSQCIIKWLDQARTCPICRAVVIPSSPPPPPPPPPLETDRFIIEEPLDDDH